MNEAERTSVLKARNLLRSALQELENLTEEPKGLAVQKRTEGLRAAILEVITEHAPTPISPGAVWARIEKKSSEESVRAAMSAMVRNGTIKRSSRGRYAL